MQIFPISDVDYETETKLSQALGHIFMTTTTPTTTTECLYQTTTTPHITLLFQYHALLLVITH